jgi:phosphoglycolate phosphatase
VPYTKNLSSIIFDLDGTLVDTALDLAASLNFTLEENHFRKIAPELVKNLVGYGALALIRRGLEYNDVAHTEDGLRRMHRQYLDYYGDNIAVHSRPYEGCIDFLERLKERGLKLGVCTNKPAALANQLLEELNMRQFFGAVLGADSLENNKPHGDHILATLNQLQANVSSTLMVGDSKTDLDAARNAGVPVILFSHGYSPVAVQTMGAEKVIDNFQALGKLLKV